MELHSTEHSLVVPGKYLHENRGADKPLLVLLHGYSDSAPSFLRRALPELDDRFEILAPNGPFPVPQRRDGEWKEAFSWYFADLSANRITIPPGVAVGALASLVERLGLHDRPKILCGFSQGGYLLPHLARALAGVERLIAVSAGFHPQFFAEFGLRLPVSALHGIDDEVIPFAEAERDFAALGAANTGGRLIAIPGMTHQMNTDGRAALRDLLGRG